MLHKGMTKSEIERDLENKGDYVKINYLNRFIQENPPMDFKKFAYLKLAEIYERKKMFADAAKMFDSITVFCFTFSDKIKNQVRAGELYIKAGLFDKADRAIKIAMNQANTDGKYEIYSKFKSFYKKQAEDYEKELKRNNAVRVYEKLLEMKINEEERFEIKEKLNLLYEKLGKRFE